MTTNEEAKLKGKIEYWLPPETWRRYKKLAAKGRAETLTSEERVELIALSNQVEIANAKRIGYLVELAQQRQATLEEVMKQLGIKAPRVR